jgi:3-oxoacyl-[acyl-carrier protein] reductase
MKVAIVTGASRGIGACVAEGLAKDGYSVALVARSADALNEVASRITKGQTGAPEVVTYPLDVQDHDAILAMVASIIAKFGRVDLLFNNAGLGCVGSLDVPIEEFDKVLAVNLRGPFSFLQAVVPVMKRQGAGTIINLASRAGKIGFAEYGVYGASKFGLVGLSESIYRELSPLGIKVTTLCPSWVDTDMAKYSDLAAEEMINPDDILKSVRWLLSLSPAAVVKELIIECRMQIA